MRYQYKFGTGYESIEVDEEWMAVLREMDRLERNSNISESRKSIHYDAFGFEPDFMGIEEKGYAEAPENLADIFTSCPNTVRSYTVGLSRKKALLLLLGRLILPLL